MNSGQVIFTWKLSVSATQRAGGLSGSWARRFQPFGTKLTDPNAETPDIYLSSVFATEIRSG